jgi:hypothetical protein
MMYLARPVLLIAATINLCCWRSLALSLPEEADGQTYSLYYLSLHMKFEV